VRSFPGLLVEEVDGCDPIACYVALRRVIEGCDLRRRPRSCTRTPPGPIPLAVDEEKLYRPRRAVERRVATDPGLGRFLVENRVRTKRSCRPCARRSTGRWTRRRNRARGPKPDPATVTLHVYSEEVDPTSERFEGKAVLTASRAPWSTFSRLSARRDERNDKVVVFGGTCDCSRRASLEVKGRGVFKVTHNLQRRFGGPGLQHAARRRAIVGRAIGMATRGLKPVSRPVLRLLLAGHDAGAQRAGAPALALERRLLLPR